MKRSGRASVYAVRGESYTLAERIYCRGKHGRDRKQHYLDLRKQVENKWAAQNK